MTPRFHADASAPRFVYTFRDAQGRALYVGCTVDLVARLRTHRRERPWFASVARIEVDVLPDERTGMDAEEAQIRREQPIHNRVFTAHETPRRPVCAKCRRSAHANCVRSSACQCGVCAAAMERAS